MKTHIRIIQEGWMYRIEYGRRFLFWIKWRRFKLPVIEVAHWNLGGECVRTKEWFDEKREAEIIAKKWADVHIVFYKGYEIKPVQGRGRRSDISWYVKPLLPPPFHDREAGSVEYWKNQIDQHIENEKRKQLNYKKIHQIN